MAQSWSNTFTHVAEKVWGIFTLQVFLVDFNPGCVHSGHDCAHLPFLKRGLRFIQVFLQSLVDGEKDDNNPHLVRVNITKAYEIALKRYHSWFVQQLFRVSLEIDTIS